MLSESIYFKGFSCFKHDWAGFEDMRPVNVVIGRNNSGKSHLLKLVEAVAHGELSPLECSFKFRTILTRDWLEQVFIPHHRTNDLKGGNDWENHGALFVGQGVEWVVNKNGDVSDITFPDYLSAPQKFLDGGPVEARLRRIGDLLKRFKSPLNKRVFRRLAADRDIITEKSDLGLSLGQNGHGITNIFRRYLVTSNREFPRELIQSTILDALNQIFGNDGRFTEITIKVHDDNVDTTEQHWEIFLGEEKKGLVPLSSSGSGLKTVFLVLTNLLIIPEIEKRDKTDFVFAFEELENNLHPALFRRLFEYIEDYAIREKSLVFLTTHSSVALDYFGLSENAQIIHVSHDGHFARTQTVVAHMAQLQVISDLGARPSNLLQANGILWVEGPSDRIYLNRWIEILSEGSLREGRDYQVAFYGGALLARTQVASPEEAASELVNVLAINPNIVLVCDGDRLTERARLKGRVRRLKSEVSKIPTAHIWVTDAKEIENYIPGDVLGNVFEKKNLPDCQRCEPFFPMKRSESKSYIEKNLSRKSVDKVELAIRLAPMMNATVMKDRFDWESAMNGIVSKIQGWNR